MIGYVVPEFPRLSESFVAREVELVADRLPLLVMSFGHRADADATMLSGLRARGVRIDYVLDHFPFRLLALAIVFSVRSPRQALRIWRLSRRFPRVQNCSSAGRAVKAAACAALVRKHGLTRLHGHWTLPTDIAWFCSVATGIPFSFSAHAHDIYEDGAVYAQAGAEFGLGARIGAADFVATCTRRGFEHLRREAGEAASKVHLVYHGVERDAIEMGPIPSDDRPLQIVSVGRLVRYKGFDRLVVACERLRDEGVSFVCSIVGDGSERESLERQIASAGLADVVRLAGPKQRKDVLALLASADVFAFAGRPTDGQYGLPNVLLEAMASGSAVVTTWLPEIGELVRDGDNGVVVHDDDELVAALRRLTLDPAFRTRLAANGRATIAGYFDAVRSNAPLVELLGQHVPETLEVAA